LLFKNAYKIQNIYLYIYYVFYIIFFSETRQCFIFSPKKGMNA